MAEPNWSEPLATRIMVIRFMYRMSFAFHMSLHTFLLGVELMDELTVPVFQPWNDRYFKAGVALMLAFGIDDCHQLRLENGNLTYTVASPPELFAAVETYLMAHVPRCKPAPGTVQAYWTAMLTALAQTEATSWQQGEQPKVRLYHRLVHRFPSTQHTRLFQLLWIMPLVRLPVDEQEQLAVQLMSGQRPTAESTVHALRSLDRKKLDGLPYPDWVWVDATFPQLSPLHKNYP